MKKVKNNLSQSDSTVIDLVNDTTYLFRVSAVNVVGTGVTSVADTETPVVTVPP